MLGKKAGEIHILNILIRKKKKRNFVLNSSFILLYICNRLKCLNICNREESNAIIQHKIICSVWEMLIIGQSFFLTYF